MRDIKFQFLFKGLPFSSNSDGFNWHKKVYSLDQLISESLNDLCGGESILGKLVAKRQYIGIKDKSGVDVFEGDWIKAKTERNDICEVEGAVFFSEDWLEYQIEQKDHRFPICSFGVIDFSTVEVIGNIYENQELLEGKSCQK